MRLPYKKKNRLYLISHLSKWVVLLMTFLFAIVFLLSVGTGIFYFFLLFSLPGMLLFLLAYHMKRYAGATAISIISFVLSVLIENSSSGLYPENQSIIVYPAIIALVFFTLIIASVLMVKFSPKSKDALRQRLWTIVYNAILLLFFFVSLQFTTEMPCGSGPSEFTKIYIPLLLVIFLSLIFYPLALLIHKCEIIKRDSTTDLGLSLLFWGTFVAYPAHVDNIY